jgi:hypothetical protein
MNLTAQVRAFGDITNAATDGDFTKLITVEASGEMDELKRKINQMVFNLRDSIQRNTAAREAAELANRTKSEVRIPKIISWLILADQKVFGQHVPRNSYTDERNHWNDPAHSRY